MFRKKGFTLIELLIVIIIVGVLATLAIPQYTNFVEKARAAEALSMISALRTGEVAYKLEAGSFTNTLSELNIGNAYGTTASADSAGQYWGYAVDSGGFAGTAGYRLTATRNARSAGSAGGQTLIMTWSEATGSGWSGTHPGKPKQ